MSIIDDIKREVRESNSVIESAVTLIGNLVTQLREGISSDNKAALEDLVAELDRQQNALANAVAANTDVEGTEDALDEDAPGETPAGEYENPADNPNNNSNNPDSVEVEDQVVTPDEAAGEDDETD